MQNHINEILHKLKKHVKQGFHSNEFYKNNMLKIFIRKLT